MNRRTAADLLPWWVLRVHWGLGIVLLAAFTDASRLALLAAAAAWAGGAAMDRAGFPREGVSRFGTPLVATLVAVAAAELLFGSRDLLLALFFLLLGIQSLKLLLPKRSRDGWQLCAIALLEFLAAAASTDALAFALSAFLFFSCSAGAMWALHNLEADEDGRPRGGYVPPLRHAAAGLLLSGVAGFLVTGLLFASVPRLEFGRILHRFSRTHDIAGFTDAITLREVTGIKTDHRVVARVEFPSLRPGLAPETLYLRAVAYPRYEDGGWRSGRGGIVPVQRAGFRHLVGYAPPSQLSIADITLEPADSPALPVYGHPVRIEESFGPIFADSEGGLLLEQPFHPALRYRLYFAPGLPPRSAAAAVPGNGQEYLHFPDGYDDVRALAQRIAGDAPTAAGQAARLLAFFGDGFRYTLTDPASSVRQFLFQKRAGYCEHYASALALLLRAEGIPSRVVAGYLGGEWNGIGQYLIVRRSDAHAWVEAWIDGRWVTMDATPALGPGSPFSVKTGAVGLYADWLRQRWDKYVINYSLQMQLRTMAGGWSAVRSAGRFLGIARWPGERAPAARFAGAALLALPLLLLFRRLLRRKRGRAGRAGGRFELPSPYARLLCRLERGGYRSSPGDPMEAMVEAAVRAHPHLAEPAARFLELYHRDRFGAAPLSPAAREEACLLAGTLGREIVAG